MGHGWCPRPRSSRPPAALLFLSAALTMLTACASVPKLNSAIDRASLSGRTVPIMGSRGPLSKAQSAAILVRLHAQAKDTDLLERHLAVEQAVSETPLVAGNRTTLLRDGGQTFAAMFAAIHGAKHHLDLEYYIFEDVANGGEHLGDLLIAKRRAGLRINVIYDSIGSLGTPQAFIDRLRKAGINLVEFNPINPLQARGGYALNERDHRKILIADGITAIVGGVNMSTAYEQHPFGRLVGSDGTPTDYWRDTDLEIQGPAVAELQRLFEQHWVEQKGPKLDHADFFPKVPAMGREVLHIIGSSHGETIPHYYATLLSAIRNAQNRILVTTAYFVPTEEEVEDLSEAGRRGVDVRLLLPGKSDSQLALAVGQSHYGELLEAGVKIYETPNEVLHSKTIVIDGVWSAIGSSNFDHRSTLFNDEVDAVVLGADTARQLEATFQDDLRNATAVDREAWENRPFQRKLDEMYSRLWQNLL
jgi:cardiolipin synthase A/B